MQRSTLTLTLILLSMLCLTPPSIAAAALYPAERPALSASGDTFTITASDPVSSYGNWACTVESSIGALSVGAVRTRCPAIGAATLTKVETFLLFFTQYTFIDSAGTTFTGRPR